MQIRKFVCGPVETNCYLVWDEGKALLIDAPQDSMNNVLEMLDKNKLKLILIANTHGHWDHVVENALLKEKTSAVIAVHKSDEKMLWNPKGTMFKPEDINKISGMPPSRADTHLDEGDVIKIGGIALEVIETPGHSPGSVCLFESRQKILFSGDTLFAGSYGRTDFPGGDHKKMVASLKKLFKLPQDTKVYPGHGSETLLSREKWIEEMI